MAITVLSSPSGEPSAQDSLWHVIDSDNKATPDFKYVFDLWVGGSQLLRVKAFPEPNNGYGYFDAMMPVSDSFTYQWFNPLEEVYLPSPNVSGEIALTYQMRYGEEVSGLTTTNLASGNTTAYNFVPELFKRRTYDMTAKLNKWLTDRPLKTKVGINDNLFIAFRTNATLTLKVDTFGYDGNPIAQNVDASGYSAANFVQLNVSPKAINDRFGTNIITNNVMYYDVWFNSFDKLRVYISCNPKYEGATLHFMNYWGMYETVNFELAKRLLMEAERKSYQQKDYTNGTTVQYIANNKYIESKINHYQSKQFSYRLTKDAMTDEEYEWLSQIITSPQIYFEQDGYFYPVTIKESSYEFSTYVNNRLRVLELTIEFNTQRNAHKR